jgi:hypothetical protein
MRFFIHSGTDVPPLVERYDSATLALEAVTRLQASSLSNLRIVDKDGADVNLRTLHDMAVEENENDDA